MIEIGMHKIYKNFGYKQVLKDINFEILTGDRVFFLLIICSLISTLFKMIMKKEFPDTGNITILLICKRSSRGLSASHDDNVITIANEILARIKAETLITFDTDYLFRFLSLYFDNSLIIQAYVV